MHDDQSVSDSPTNPDTQATAILDLLIRGLVDAPDDVEIHAVRSEQTTIFEVRVGPDDVRRVIGRRGRTADAARELLHNLGAKAGRRYHLEILEPSNRVTIALGC